MKEVIDFLKSLPFIGPLVKLAWSRKGMLTSVIVSLIGKYLISIPPTMEGYVTQVVGGLLAIAIIVSANILGIAYEDAAAKRA